jgi:hypothetical protein
MSVELKDVGPWSPLIWSIIKNCGPTEAVVWGIVWSYSKMKNSNCSASIGNIGKASGVSEDTARRCLKKLIEAGYLKQIGNSNGGITPNSKGLTNTYVVTEKAGLKTVAFDHPDGSSSPDEYAEYGE